MSTATAPVGAIAPPIADYAWRGVFIGVGVVSLWAIHLFYALTVAPTFYWATPFHIALQSFLNVGLFITAHDAIHGSLAPGKRRLNDAVGATAIFLYGGFVWKKMCENHHAHHANPATDRDPDFAEDGDERPLRWLLAFMKRYYSWFNFSVMFVYVMIAWWLSGSYPGMFLYFAIPAWISAGQLFMFGIYLPHRTPPGGHTHPHRTVTLDYPEWLSFLACYHFGYHEEHHDYPGAPWWRLPAVRRAALASKSSSRDGI